MTEKKIYIGSVGPFLYNDDNLISDPDGDFSGEYHQGLATDGNALIGGDQSVTGDLTVGGDLDVTGALEVDSIETGEILLTPKSSSSGAEGTIYYDSDDDYVYVATE